MSSGVAIRSNCACWARSWLICCITVRVAPGTFFMFWNILTRATPACPTNLTPSAVCTTLAAASAADDFALLELQSNRIETIVERLNRRLDRVQHVLAQRLGQHAGLASSC